MTVVATQRDMPLKEWLTVPIWPNQRSTKAHAKKLTSKKSFNPRHPSLGRHCGLVTVGGTTYKVNGITTTYLHTIGKCFYPDTVHCEHYYCDTMDEAQSIYNSFDPSWAGKGCKDRLVSALAASNIELVSATFSNGKGTTGLSLTFNGLRGVQSTAAPEDVDGMVRSLKYDIIAVDRLGLAGATGGGTVAICAALYSHRAARNAPVDDREDALFAWAEFWNAFVESKGQKIGYASSSYNVLWNLIAKEATGHRDNTIPLVERGLYCFSRGKMGKIDGMPRRTTMDKFYSPRAKFETIGATASRKSKSKSKSRHPGLDEATM
jgi:hypothetical protein